MNLSALQIRTKTTADESYVEKLVRAAFADGTAEQERRLLYRLWLSMPNSRALPEGHEVLWGTTAAGALRGGIGQESASSAQA